MRGTTDYGNVYKPEDMMLSVCSNADQVLYLEGAPNVEHISGEMNLADVLTKPRFVKLTIRRLIGIDARP